MSLSPTFAETLRAAIDAGAKDIHVSIPGSVESWDADTQKVSVKPLIRRGFTNEEGERDTESLPVITEVPVLFPGSGAISITWPVAIGSTGLIVFSEASIDKWLSRGGEVDPNDDRHHTLSDAIFIPGLRPFSDPVEGVHSTAMVIQAPLIHAGGTESLALKSDVDELRTRFNAHIGLSAGGFGHTLTASVPAGTMVGTSVLKGS
jgi:hypothetical protein